MAVMEPSADAGADRARVLDFNALRAAETRHDPFDYFCATGALTNEQAAAIRSDYPAIDKPGYLPLSKLERQGAFDALIADLESAELAQVLTEKFGVDFTDKPRMITVRRLSQLSDGPIHVDSKAKILTMLVYLNESWDGTSDGCLRVLRSNKGFDDYAEEVAPLAGTVFAFLRSDTSWHGHLPFAGERYVVQTTFLTSEDELARKEKRERQHLWIKKLNPFV